MLHSDWPAVSCAPAILHPSWSEGWAAVRLKSLHQNDAKLTDFSTPLFWSPAHSLPQIHAFIFILTPYMEFSSLYDVIRNPQIRNLCVCVRSPWFKPPGCPVSTSSGLLPGQQDSLLKASAELKVAQWWKRDQSGWRLDCGVHLNPRLTTKAVLLYLELLQRKF